MDYMETAESHAVSDEDVEQTLAQFPEDKYILAEDFTTWSETIYADLQAEQSETMQLWPRMFTFRSHGTRQSPRESCGTYNRTTYFS